MLRYKLQQMAESYGVNYKYSITNMRKNGTD